MLHILHFADLHLDSSFASSGLPLNVGSWRRADLRATLGRILTLARERQVDVVTIAGGLYEQSFAQPDTAEFLVQQFAKLDPIRVVMAPGESDPYTQDSLYALSRWSDNVTIFSEGKLTAVEIDPGIFLWGAACPPARSQGTLDRFRVDRDGLNLVLLHATDAATASKGLYQVDRNAVRSAGFDFALLGHRHTSRLWPEDSPCCVYPGSPEPLAPEEASGSHQTVLLNIEDGVCRPEAISVSQWRYLSLDVDLTECESTEEAADHVEQSLETICGGGDERVLCRVTLTGLPKFSLDLGTLAGHVETKAGLQFETQLTFPHNLDQLAQEQTVRGTLVRRFQARLGDSKSLGERTLAESALLCALQALDGRQVGFDEVR